MPSSDSRARGLGIVPRFVHADNDLARHPVGLRRSREVRTPGTGASAGAFANAGIPQECATVSGRDLGACLRRNGVPEACVELGDQGLRECLRDNGGASGRGAPSKNESSLKQLGTASGTTGMREDSAIRPGAAKGPRNEKNGGVDAADPGASPRGAGTSGAGTSDGGAKQ